VIVLQEHTQILVLRNVLYVPLVSTVKLQHPFPQDAPSIRDLIKDLLLVRPVKMVNTVLGMGW